MLQHQPTTRPNPTMFGSTRCFRPAVLCRELSINTTKYVDADGPNKPQKYRTKIKCTGARVLMGHTSVDSSDAGHKS